MRINLSFCCSNKLKGLVEMIKIDIDKLTESELIEQNHKIVARLQFLNQKTKI
jgi:hypothetical protein